MKFSEAIEMARHGNFMTNVYFDKGQSLHYFNGKYYYEDGAVLDADFLHSLKYEDWSKDNWSIKCPVDKVDMDILKATHAKWQFGMITDGTTYENCFKKDK